MHHRPAGPPLSARLAGALTPAGPRPCDCARGGRLALGALVSTVAGRARPRRARSSRAAAADVGRGARPRSRPHAPRAVRRRRLPGRDGRRRRPVASTYAGVGSGDGRRTASRPPTAADTPTALRPRRGGSGTTAAVPPAVPRLRSPKSPSRSRWRRRRPPRGARVRRPRGARPDGRCAARPDGRRPPAAPADPGVEEQMLALVNAERAAAAAPRSSLTTTSPRWLGRTARPCVTATSSATSTPTDSTRSTVRAAGRRRPGREHRARASPTPPPSWPPGWTAPATARTSSTAA